MEAIIAEKHDSGDQKGADAAALVAGDLDLFGILQDQRKVAVVLERAEHGSNWKRCAAVAGVDVETIRLWRRAYPIDALAAKLIMRAAPSAVLRIAAKMEEAAEVTCNHLDGTFTAKRPVINGITGEVVGEAVDYEAERLKAAAAKTTLGIAQALLEKVDPKSLEAPPEVQAKSRDLTESELVAAARVASRLVKGK